MKCRSKGRKVCIIRNGWRGVGGGGGYTKFISEMFSINRNYGFLLSKFAD